MSKATLQVIGVQANCALNIASAGLVSDLRFSANDDLRGGHLTELLSKRIVAGPAISVVTAHGK